MTLLSDRHIDHVNAALRRIDRDTDTASAPTHVAPQTDAAPGHAWRGVLIALIVLGHNRLFETAFYEVYRLVYNVHVEAFLIVPFLRADSGGRTNPLHALRTYYRPFWAFVTGYALLFAVSDLPGAPQSAGDAILRYGQALLIANSTTLDRATGFEMFWYLPVFILLSSLRPPLTRLRPAWFAILLCGAAVAHLTVGYLDAAAVAVLPWGLPILGYMLFPCLIATAIARSGLGRAMPLWVPATLFIAATALCCIDTVWINLSDFKVYDVGHPGALLLTDLDMIAASIFVLRISPYLRVRALDALGRYSLQIYLIHGIFGYALVRLVGRNHPLAVALPLLAITYGATLIGSLLAARWLMKRRLGAWIFSAR